MTAWLGQRLSTPRSPYSYAIQMSLQLRQAAWYALVYQQMPVLRTAEVALSRVGCKGIIMGLRA